jgi:uncharacterized protein (DUF433 family)
MDWSKCPDAERAPDMVSGVWVVKGTRVPVQAVVDNAEDGYTAEQITGEIFEGLAVDRVRSVIRFASVVATKVVHQEEGFPALGLNLTKALDGGGFGWG